MTYALVMIVKNAAADIERCLAAARPYISSWTICDTGSTDGTQGLIRATLDGIPGTLYEDEWANFGHNRSLALERARGTADWLLLMDADMAVTIEPGFVPDPTVDAYMLEMGTYTDFSYRLPLLVRGDIPWKSFGPVHEYTARSDGLGYSTTPTDLVRVDMGNVYRGSLEKYNGYAALLEPWLAEHPDDARSTYYLAQSYQCVGRNEEARTWFAKRAAMGGFMAEAAYAAYLAAMLAPDWPTKASELMAAWEMHPERLEPLHELVRGLNQRDQHRTAYALACVAPMDCTDILFVHRSVWNWGMTFERSIAAWYCGFPDETRALSENLLERDDLPADVRAAVERNRGLCEKAA